MFDEIDPFSDAFEMPKPESGDYLNKLEEGETKLRILADPIVGWQDWQGVKPLRFRSNEKPDKPIDPKKKIKLFFGLIVWNYGHTKDRKFQEVNKIQIFCPDKAQITNGIKSYATDPDWGKPQAYDIKITRTGLDEKTKYVVVPLPKKVIDQHIIDAFKAKPICLTALFGGGDPFASGQSYYSLSPQALGLTEAKPAVGLITKVQYDELMAYVYADDEYIKKLEENVKKHFGTTIKELPSSKYEALLKSVKLYAKEKATKEMEAHNEQLPF